MSQILNSAQKASSGGTVTSVSAGNNISITGTATINPTVNVAGTTQYAVQVGAASGALTSLAVGTAGQVLTSNGAGANPSFQAAAAGGITTVDGNSGSVTGSTVTITDSQGTGAFTGSGTTLTHTYTSLDTNYNTILGSRNSNAISGNTNTAFGDYSAHALTSGSGNTFTGQGAGAGISTGNLNCAFGLDTLGAGNSSSNTALGTSALISLVNGAYNTAVGRNAGGNYNGAETNNIILGSSLGTIGESSVMRLGNDGTVGGVTTTQTYLRGAYGNSPASAQALIINSSGQLGSQAFPTSSISIAGDSGGALTGNSFTLTGGSSGAVFAGSGTTLTQSFNYLSLPTTTSTNGQIQINGTPVLHTYGNGTNIFVGEGSGNFTLSSVDCVAVGSGCLTSLTSGTDNIALGLTALAELTTGGANIGIGTESLISLATGNYNTCIGYFSGTGYSGSESSNILIGSQNYGTAGESHTLRIGSGTGTGIGNLNKCFISGITGITVTGTAVLVSSGNQLGIAVSSQRYKENIQPLEATRILDLQPKRFNYNVGEDRSPQTGLIAEEVYKIMPELVVLDKQGLPQTVKYHELPVLLLLEIQKLNKRIAQLEKRG